MLISPGVQCGRPWPVSGMARGPSSQPAGVAVQQGPGPQLLLCLQQAAVLWSQAGQCGRAGAGEVPGGRGVC